MECLGGDARGVIGAGTKFNRMGRISGGGFAGALLIERAA
jgi:hypothetical protein